jgi:hypothetical protein
MKGVILVIALALCWLLPGSTVYAGSLNKYENQVIAEAKRTYIYKGKEYRVTDTYINQLVDYLSSEEVDITAEQRDAALRMAYDSIERGVQEGYLVPVEEIQENPLPTEAVPEEKSEEDMESEPPIPQPNEAEGKPEPAAIEPDIVTETAGEGITAVPSGEQEEIEKRFEAIIGESVIDKTNSLAPDRMDSSIIKETGFSFNSTIFVIVGIIILMIIGFIAALRMNYFAHSDE